MGVLIRNQGSSSNLVSLVMNTVVPNDTDTTITYTFNNGVHTCACGNETQSNTNSYTPTLLKEISVGSKNVAREFKVKAL